MRLYGEAFSVSLTSPRFAGSPREPEWSNDGIQEGTATFHDEQILPTMKIAGNLEGAVGDDTTEGAGNSTRAIEDGDTKGRVVQDIDEKADGYELLFGLDEDMAKGEGKDTPTGGDESNPVR
ncbi:MAG: hypothetical protein LQ347_003316 [Umbilicaria vellea]|nr:MAG: hypothetical protein LQ347_003316 [Umbilicaria vellea]